MIALLVVLGAFLLVWTWLIGWAGLALALGALALTAFVCWMVNS